jgi:hypothetical protein
MSNLIQQKQVQGLVSDLAAKALDSAVVKKSNNLSDINAASARANLGIYSQSEVNSLIAGAENAFSVASLTARGALSGLKVSDRIFVSNDGDGKWALYIVTAITDGAGSTSTFQKIADEDIFTNALSASAVKSAYESNGNTNAFTDAEKSKVGHITVTQAVNLDTIESGLASSTAMANSALSTANAASTAASNAQATANGAVADAATAQSTAENAASAAANAQTLANSKEEAFSHHTEEFTGLSGELDQSVLIALAYPIASGFTPQVYFNGLVVQKVTYTVGSPEITFSVPYQTEPTDLILVTYHWR